MLVTAGSNYYARLADLDFAEARRQVEEHLLLPLHLARAATGKVRAAGTLLFMGGTGGRGLGLALPGALTAALPALIANLALELAPVGVNLIAAGFVDTPTLRPAPRRPARAAPRSAAPHTADQAGRRTSRGRGACHPPHDQHGAPGATYDIDGGQQLV